MSEHTPFRLWQVPVSVWAYGFLRAVAFAVPPSPGAISGGIDLIVALPLFVLLVRGSRLAWSVLLVLDTLTLVLLLATQQATHAPWLIHICIAGAIIALLVPSSRAWVTGPSAARSQR